MGNEEIALHLTVAAMDKGIVTFENEAETAKNIVTLYKDICSELSAPADKVSCKPLQRPHAKVYNN